MVFAATVLMSLLMPLTQLAFLVALQTAKKGNFPARFAYSLIGLFVM